MILGFIIFVFIFIVFISIESKANKEKEKQEKMLEEEKRRADFEEETLKWFTSEVLKKQNFVYKFKNIGYLVDISNIRVDRVIRYDVSITDLETSVKTEHSSFCYIQKYNVSGCKTSISQCIEYAISKHIKSVNFDKMIGVE